MTDTFSKHSRSLTSAPEHSIAIVLPDAADLVHVIRAPGDVAVRLQDGTLIAVRVARVLATGTRAGRIRGFLVEVALALVTGVAAEADRGSRPDPTFPPIQEPGQ